MKKGLRRVRFSAGQNCFSFPAKGHLGDKTSSMKTVNRRMLWVCGTFGTSHFYDRAFWGRRHHKRPVWGNWRGLWYYLGSCWPAQVSVSSFSILFQVLDESPKILEHLTRDSCQHFLTVSKRMCIGQAHQIVRCVQGFFIHFPTFSASWPWWLTGFHGPQGARMWNKYHTSSMGVFLYLIILFSKFSFPPHFLSFLSLSLFPSSDVPVYTVSGLGTFWSFSSCLCTSVIESFIFSDVKTLRTEIKGTLHSD